MYKWISVKQLQKRWHDAPTRDIRDAIERGLNVYYEANSQRMPEMIEKDAFVRRFESTPFWEYWQSVLLFKLDDVLRFEEKEGLRMGSGLPGQEKTELGRLRREKQNWDKTIEAAVVAGICAAQNGKVRKTQLFDVLQKLKIPQTSFEKIWAAIPAEFKYPAGRPLKTD